MKLLIKLNLLPHFATNVTTLFIGLFGLGISMQAQTQYELGVGWRCINSKSLPVNTTGEKISQQSYRIEEWLPATVPGTVLTNLMNNHLMPDPFWGLNLKFIPDITSGCNYTYWFAVDFTEAKPQNSGQVWLEFRGINYSAQVFLNGKQLLPDPIGMFERHSYNITNYLTSGNKNRLAVLVNPPPVTGIPNGGQGGDGTIAKNVTNQFVAGWDWIPPIPDRNTGIWDKVSIVKTGLIRIKNPHVITLVPGTRNPEDFIQKPAIIKVTAELENPTQKGFYGELSYVLEGKTVVEKIRIPPTKTVTVTLPDYEMQNPKLWWTNGYGGQPLYTMDIKVTDPTKKMVDESKLKFGVREITGYWNKKTNSREVRVNGRRIFIKGGNWILSDAFLRLSQQRYDDEVRLHRDMNLNLLRVWGGGITERPEFYDACDKYGILVMQDFWITGDCNGRWYDDLKKEDTNTRRKYPDDHRLFISSLEDQIKMLRNHPSLSIWCGGNEIAPPQDILTVLKDTLLPLLDATRIFFPNSNSDSMSFNSHDGPYTVQPEGYFYSHRSYPFNSEIGSVGIGEIESLERFLPSPNLLVFPKRINGTWEIDSVWKYHKYNNYDSSILPYGEPFDTKDFCKKAQLVNYSQYRALAEGFYKSEWDWYTGFIIWKTQNPWTALTGQMYDPYLDPNAGMFGLKEGTKQVHILFNPVTKDVVVANNSHRNFQKMSLLIQMLDFKGILLLEITRPFVCNSDTSESVYTFSENSGKSSIDSVFKSEGAFLRLSLYDSSNSFLVDENLYWIPDDRGNFSGLQKMTNAKIIPSLRILEPGLAEVTIENPSFENIAFFNRVSLVDSKSKKYILPAFYSNNYLSVLPHKKKSILIQYRSEENVIPWVEIEGWNVARQYVSSSKR